MFGSERERSRAFSDGRERSRKPTFGVGGSGGHGSLISTGYPFDDSEAPASTSSSTSTTTRGTIQTTYTNEQLSEKIVDLAVSPLMVDVGRVNGFDSGGEGNGNDRPHMGTYYTHTQSNRTDGYAPVQVSNGSTGGGKRESMKIFGIELKWIS